MAALAICACALGPAASAEAAATPLDQLTGAVAGATGDTTAQVVGTVNATAGQAGAVVEGVRQAAVPVLRDTGAQARQSVDALSATPGRGVATVTGATGAARGTARTAGVALSADDGGSAPAAAIHETTAPAARAHHLRLTSRRPEGAATSARAGTGTKAARGPAAPASVGPSGSAGAERQQSAAAPRVFPGIPGLGLGTDDGGLATGATALMLFSAFALLLIMGGTVPPGLRSRLSVPTGIRRSPPLILALDRPG